jgi:uncharacterized damage-inducible protein DinB
VDARAHYGRLFAHDAWANRETLASLRRAARLPEKSLGRFAHLLSAERLWLERVLARPQTQKVWPDFDLDACGREIEALTADWRPVLGSLDDARLDATLSYVNTKGERWQSRLGDVLDHVITHGSYHRGQIASDLRSAGCEPVLTDFIHAVRSGEI